MKFIKPFKGVTDGNVLLTIFEVGEDCPRELEEAALELCVVAKPKKLPQPANQAQVVAPVVVAGSNVSDGTEAPAE